MTSLYVIGNGFDLHHGLATTYGDFQTFVERNHPTLYTLGEQHFENWDDFEENLGDMDWDTIKNNSYDDMGEYNQELGLNWVWEECVERKIDQFKKLPDVFSEWADSIKPRPMGLEKLNIPFTPNDYFLNFNFTDTLETRYGIEPARIFYIHGKANEASKPIIVGHSGRYFSTKATCKDDLAEQSEYADSIMQEYLDTTEKPTEKVSHNNEKWFKSVRSIQDIFVFGHSLSAVDQCYFQNLHHHNPDLRWHFSYYNSYDIIRILQFVGSIGLDYRQVIKIAHLEEFSGV